MNWKRWPDEKPDSAKRDYILVSWDHSPKSVEYFRPGRFVDCHAVNDGFPLQPAFWIYESELLATIPTVESAQARIREQAGK